MNKYQEAFDFIDKNCTPKNTEESMLKKLSECGIAMQELIDWHETLQANIEVLLKSDMDDAEKWETLVLILEGEC